METASTKSNIILLKRDKLFWFLTIFFFWLFPPVSIFLLFTKKGEVGLYNKTLGRLVEKFNVWNAKRMEKHKKIKPFDFKELLKATKENIKETNQKIKDDSEAEKKIVSTLSPQEKLKRSFVKGTWVMGAIKLIIKTKVFWLASIIALGCLQVGYIRQSFFNKSYMDKLLSQGEMTVSYIIDDFYKDEKIPVKFYYRFQNGNLDYIQDVGGKYNAYMNLKMGGVYNSYFPDESAYELTKMTDYNYGGKFNFKFESPSNPMAGGKVIGREIFETLNLSLRVQFNSSDYRDFLAFWSFIPNLLFENFPTNKSQGVYDGTVKFSLTLNQRDEQEGNLTKGEKRTTSESHNYDAIINISPDVFAEKGSITKQISAPANTNSVSNNKTIEDIKPTTTKSEVITDSLAKYDQNEAEPYIADNEPETLTIVGNKVRLRKESNTSSEIVTELNSGDICSIMERGKKEETIGNNTDIWYHVIVNDKEEGWVFGSFTSRKK